LNDHTRVKNGRAIIAQQRRHFGERIQARHATTLRVRWLIATGQVDPLERRKHAALARVRTRRRHQKEHEIPPLLVSEVVNLSDSQPLTFSSDPAAKNRLK
jgi:hypothetical protein